MLPAQPFLYTGQVHVSAFQRWFTVMACIATLLVMVAPLVSRKMNHPASAHTAYVSPDDISLPAALLAAPEHAHGHGDEHALHDPSAHVQQQTHGPGPDPGKAHAHAGGDAHADHPLQHEHAHGHDVHDGAVAGTAAPSATLTDPAAATPADDPHAGHDMGVECDYCLIAARMLAFVVALLLALNALPAVRHLPSPSAPRRIAAPVSRLGARGPPLLAA